MADTITLKSDSYDGRYMKLVCTQTPNGSAENTSTIKWALSTVGGNSSYYSTGATKVVINGTTVYSKARVDWSSGSFPASTGSTSGEITVSHKTDGTKSVSVSFSTAIYTTTVSTYDDTWELDPIARYGTSVQSLNSATETTIKMNWSSDNTVDYLWYSTDNGSSWTGKNVTDSKSGTYTISGLTADTEYKIKTRIRRKDSQLTTDSSALSVTTYDYPYCTDSPSFTLGDEVTLKFYNPLKRSFLFYIIGNNTQIDVEYTCSSTSYTGLTSTKTTVPYLYATIPNAVYGAYKVKVVYGSSTKTLNNGNRYTINTDNCYPTFSTFTYKDSNTTVTAVTGNDQVLVKGLSTLSVTIPSANKMEAKNSATAKNYIASIDTLSKTIAYSSDSDVSGNLGVVKSAGKKRLNVTAYDSRGISTLAYEDITVYDYTKPVINVKATRLNNVESQTTLSVSGSYSRLTIGGTDKNTIEEVRYQYRESGGAWSDWLTLSTTATNGKFSCSDVVMSLDKAKAFEFQVYVGDSLSSNTGSATVDIGHAVFFISTNMKKCYTNGDEVATLNSAYPVGSVYCSSTNTNPSTMFGGTGTLIDKEFKYGHTTVEQSATPYLSQFVVTSIRAGHTIRLRFSLTTSAELTDTEVVLGTVNFTDHGLQDNGSGYIPYSILGDPAISDGGNALLDLDLEYTGALECRDVLVNGSTHSLPAGANFYYNVTIPVSYDRINDSFCNKFYWQRTA